MKWAQRALSACAVLLLCYCGFTLVDAWVFQKRESGDLDRMLRGQRALSGGTPRPVYPASPQGTSATTGGLIGRIVIPRLLLTAVVVEGIDKTTLRRGVGHIPGTSLPGEQGNVGLAGHRDILFRPLKDLRLKDEIQFSTLNGEFRYVVESILVIDPHNVGVLAPTSENMLTLVTCYPFFYVGPAPKRFVVRARQAQSRTVVRSTEE
jgi:sortase A